jgi:hypothetical protein
MYPTQSELTIKSYAPRGPAIRLAINGHFLDEVRTPREKQDDTEADPYISFPMEDYRAGFDGEATMLYLPLTAALQLYHDGVLPADRTQPITLTVGTRTKGPLYVEWMRHVAKSYHHGERVLLRLVPRSVQKLKLEGVMRQRYDKN